MSSNSDPVRNGRGRRFLRKLLIVTSLAAAGLLCLWNLLPPKTIDQPVVFVRNEQGELAPFSEDRNEAGVTFDIYFGTLQSQNNSFSSSSSGSTDPSFFAGRSLAIFNLSDHLLMQRAGRELLEQLTQDREFERVEYYPLGHSPEVGSQATDLIVTLDIRSLEVSGWVSQKVDASIVGSLGRSFSHTTTSYVTSAAPPIVRMNADIELTHHSTMRGVESSAAKYKLQGKDIGGALAKQVTDKLKSLREEHELLPALPAGFYPQWRPTPEFDFVDEYGAERMTSQHGLGFHNETFWRITGTEFINAALASIHAELLERGWEGELDAINDSGYAYMRLTKDNLVLVAFTNPGMRASPQPKEPIDLYVRYHDAMKMEEYYDAVEGLLGGAKPDFDLLLKLKRYTSPDQEQRLFEMVEMHAPRTTSAWIALADHYVSRKDNSKAEQALRAGSLLNLVSNNSSANDDEIERLANLLSLKVNDLQRPDIAVLSRLEIPILPPGGVPLEREVGVGETAAFFFHKATGGWVIAAVTLHRRWHNGSSSTYDLTEVLASENGRSSTRVSRNLKEPRRTTRGIDDWYVTLQAESNDDEGIRVRVEAHKSPRTLELQ